MLHNVVISIRYIICICIMLSVDYKYVYGVGKCVGSDCTIVKIRKLGMYTDEINERMKSKEESVRKWNHTRRERELKRREKRKEIVCFNDAFVGRQLIREIGIELNVLYSKISFFLPFRFPRMLWVQENVQVENGFKSTRSRGMRQNFVHVSVLPQHHAHEVQPAQPSEERTRLRDQDLKWPNFRTDRIVFREWSFFLPYCTLHQR